jgi:hypothetical protein
MLIRPGHERPVKNRDFADLVKVGNELLNPSPHPPGCSCQLCRRQRVWTQQRAADVTRQIFAAASPSVTEIQP